MPSPPSPVISVLDLETLMDAYAYLLATDTRTSNVNWILGDVGMGRPDKVPFGYISQLSEAPIWVSANGGTGGMAAGLDDWLIPVVITVAFENHRYLPPIRGVPPSNSPFNPTNNSGFTVPYQEQPGWRRALQITQEVKKVLRTNPTIKAAATDTRIIEARYLLQEINDVPYRAARLTIQTQQRRVRGN